MTTLSDHRLARLPGFDTAPDVYETPNDNNSSSSSDTNTTAQTSPQSAAPPSETSEEDSEDEGVSKRRIYPERARTRFGGIGIDGKGVDLSDRVDGRRRGYRVRRGYGEEEEEGLEGRIARLRREVEECRVLAEKGREEGEGEGAGEGVDEVEELSRLLAGIEGSTTTPTVRRGKGHQRTGSVFHDALPTHDAQEEDDEGKDEERGDEQTLTKITTFDARLSSLEAALGMASLLNEEATLSTPLMPTLALLDSQLATLNSATSLSNLEAAFSRINKLKAEAQQLAHLQSHPPDDDDDDDDENDEDEGSGTHSTKTSLLSPDDVKSLHSLYTLLPTLQSLSPTVPALVARLRSLRTLHAAAANADTDLEAVQQRQVEMDRELKMWREGLDKVEKAVDTADKANGMNGHAVKEWIGDLEKRMAALGR